MPRVARFWAKRALEAGIGGPAFEKGMQEEQDKMAADPTVQEWMRTRDREVRMAGMKSSVFHAIMEAEAYAAPWRGPEAHRLAWAWWWRARLYAAATMREEYQP